MLQNKSQKDMLIENEDRCFFVLHVSVGSARNICMRQNLGVARVNSILMNGLGVVSAY